MSNPGNFVRSIVRVTRNPPFPLPVTHKLEGLFLSFLISLSCAVPGSAQATIGGDLDGIVTEDAQRDTARGTVTITGGATFTVQTNAPGTYGTFSIEANGEWTYRLDNSRDATDNLRSGQRVTERFPIAASDGTTATVTITVKGSDPFEGTFTDSVTEGRPRNSPIRGSIGDVFGDFNSTSSIQAVAKTELVYGTYWVVVDPAGLEAVWRYLLNNDDDDTNALAAGATVTETFTISNMDSEQVTVTITITGTDDPSTIGGMLEGTVTEDAEKPDNTPDNMATGRVTVADVDTTPTPSITGKAETGIYGSFTITTAGVWTYTLNNDDPDTNVLAVGATATDTFTITTSDGTKATVTITITGAADTGIIEGELRGRVIEDDTSNDMARGTVMVTDVGSATFTAQTDALGTYGTFSLNANGTWTYTLNNDDNDTNALAAGQMEEDTFPIAASNGATATVTITITGANDPSTIGGELFGVVVEDADPNTVKKMATLTDVDGATFVEQTNTEGIYGTFGIKADGEWTYELDNDRKATNDLTHGQQVTERFPIAASDGTTATVTITVRGSDPFEGTFTGSVTEDRPRNSPIRGSIGDVFGDFNSTVSIQEVAKTELVYGTYWVVVDPAGLEAVWRYLLNNDDDDTNALAAGATVTETFTISNMDSEQVTVTITITGAADTAIIEGELRGRVIEDDTSNDMARGTVMVTDVGSATFTAQTDALGTYGTFSLNANGTWTYTLNNDDNDTNALTAGQMEEDAFPIVASNGATATVTITITGANDPSTIGGELFGVVVEDADPNTVKKMATLTDVDGATFVEQTNTEGIYGTFGIKADGEWTYELDNDRKVTDDLTRRQRVTERFPIAASDGATATVTITVRGSDPFEGTFRGSVTEDRPRNSPIRGSIGDVFGDFNSTSNIQAVAKTDLVYGTYWVVVDPTGLEAIWRYLLNNDDDDTNALAAGATVTETFTISNMDSEQVTVTITINGANDAAVFGMAGLTGTITEDARKADDTPDNQITVTATVTDVDGTDNIFKTDVTPTTGKYGSLTITTAGVWTYTLNNDDADTDALKAGQSVNDETFAILSEDGTEATVTITINGANDAAVFGMAGLTGTITEDARKADDTPDNQITATATVTDVDGTDNIFKTDVTPTTGKYGSLTITTAGVWTYTLNNDDADTDALKAGQSVNDETFTILSEDGTEAMVTITINGANDAARFDESTLMGAIDEDVATTTGTIRATDVDGEDNKFTAVAPPNSISGSYGSLTITEVGDWTYRLDNSLNAVQSLAQGSTLKDNLTVQTADGTSGTLVITITGVNDAATFGGTSTGSVIEDATETMASGTITVTDVDGDNTLQATTMTKTYGDFAVNADGSWTYTLANTKAATNALRGGQNVSDTFQVTASDETLGPTITITITGANDLSTITGKFDGSVVEDSNATATGEVTVSDVDTPTSTDPTPSLQIQTTTGTYGSFQLSKKDTNPNTRVYSWTYTLNNTDEDTNALAAGATVMDEFTITTTDGVTKKVIITVTGADDSSTIGGALSGSVTEDDSAKLTAEGTATVTDVDSTATFVVQTNAAGSYGTFSITAAGGWTYSLDNSPGDTRGNATDALKAGQTESETFPIATSDNISATVTIAVNGANDAAVFGATGLTGAITEDADPNTVTGKVTATDVDGDNNSFKTEVAPTIGTYGSLIIETDGDWTYRLNNDLAITDALKDGQTDTDAFTVMAADGTEATVTITIMGANDATRFGTTGWTGTITEDADPNTVTGKVTATDVDGDDNSFKTEVAPTTGTYGSLIIETDGDWTYRLNNDLAITDALKEGQTDTDAFTVMAADGTEATVIITVMGSNDAARFGTTGLTGTITEDADPNTVTGKVTATDVDGDDNSFKTEVAPTTGTYGSLTIETDGDWTYRLNNDLDITDALKDGQTDTDAFTVMAADGTEATVIITVMGSNDAARFGTTGLTGAITEDADPNTVTGKVTVTDIDGNDNSFKTEVRPTTGTYGSLTIETNGDWTYRLNNAVGGAADRLNGTEDPKPTDTFTIMATDGTEATVTITITGTDDQSAIGGILTGSVTEDAHEIEVRGRATLTDVDGATFIAQTNKDGTYGRFNIDVVGIWTYNLNNAATDRLAAGDRMTDAFTIAASDGVTAMVTITVIGADDPSTIGGDLTGSVTEDDLNNTTAEGMITLTDVDGATLIIQTNVEGIYGRFTITDAGAWIYRLDNSDWDTNALAAGQMEEDSFTIAASDETEATVIITITGAADPGIIEGNLRGSVTEDDPAKAIAEGRVMVTGDNGATFTAQPDSSSYGRFTITAIGAWTYRLNNDATATNALAAGAAATDAFTITASNGTTATVTITITGAADLGSIEGDLRGSVAEDDAAKATAEGRVMVTGDDHATFAARSGLGQYGNFRITEAGVWTYSLNNSDPDTNALAEGQEVTDLFTITASNGTEATVTILITGALTKNARVRVTPQELTIVRGAGQIGRYSVVLTEPPAGDVTIIPRSEDHAVATVATVSDGAPLLFTTDSWNNPQTVTVTAALVDSQFNDPKTLSTRITHGISGGGYDDVGAVSVAINVTETDPILKSIEGYLKGRTDVLLGNQPGLTRFLKDSHSLLESTDREAVEDSTASEGDSALNGTWFELSGAQSDRNSTESDYLFGTFGIHGQVSETALAGLMLQFDFVNERLSGDQGSIKGRGWQIGPYFAVRHQTQPLYFEGRLLYGFTSNDIHFSDGGALGQRRGEFGTERWLANLRVEGEVLLDYGNIKIIPHLDAGWVREEADPFLDDKGIQVPGQTVRFEALELGSDIEIPVHTGQQGILTGGLSVILTREQDWREGAVRASTVYDVRGRADLGVDYMLDNETYLELGGFYDGVGDSEFDHRSFSLGVVNKF